MCSFLHNSPPNIHNATQGSQRKSAEGRRVNPANSRFEESEEAELQEQIFVSIKALSRELDPQDRLILRMNFEDNVSVADMARVMGLNQRRLYGQRDRILIRLRRGLESKGFSHYSVMRILGEN